MDKGFCCGLRPLLTARPPAPLGFHFNWVGSALRADLVALGRGVALPRPPKAECKAKHCPYLRRLGWHAVPTLPRKVRRIAAPNPHANHTPAHLSHVIICTFALSLTFFPLSPCPLANLSPRTARGAVPTCCPYLNITPIHVFVKGRARW